MNSNPRRTVGILIFDDAEVLDFCGPFEVLSKALLSKNVGNYLWE